MPLTRREFAAAAAALTVTRLRADPKAGVYVAVGYGGRRMRSTDGIAWEVTEEWAENGGDDNNNLMSVVFAGGKFVAVGGGVPAKGKPGGRVLTSPDGKAWAEHDGMPFRVNPVLWAKDRFVAGGPGRQLYHSADGVRWEKGAEVAVPDGVPGWAFWFRRGATGGGRHVLVGNAGKDQKTHWAVATADGATVAGSTFDLPPVRDVAFGAGRFVAVGPDGLRVSSTDGVTWEHEAREPKQPLDHVVWTDREFLATGHGKGWASADGVGWKPWPKPVPCGVLYADAGKGVWVGTMWPGQMWHSADGLTWAKGAKQPPNGINAVAYGEPAG